MTASSPDRDRPPRAAVRLRVRRGLDLPLEGAPDQAEITEGAAVASVALLGDDAPGVRAQLCVAPGERVALGQTLWIDRRRPEVRFTAPGAGVVRSVERGERRRIGAVVIDLEGDRAAEFDRVDPGRVPGLPRERVRDLLLASGLWTALRTRPFSRIPDPGSAPRSLFVTALESEPLAPRAERILAEQAEDFERGVAALARLTDGPVWVCTRPGVSPRLPDLERVRLAEFEGPHPAGLAGTHIHELDPVGPGHTVWHVAYPDAIAVGRLLVTGRLPIARVVSLAGAAVARPRLVRTRLGASTEDLLAGELLPTPARVLSGSVLAGRHAVGWGSYLGRLHTQVCALPEGEGEHDGPPGWLVPGRGGRPRRVLRAFGRRRPARRGYTTSLGGRRGPFFPLERLEGVVPLDLPVAPLLRALVTGHLELALELGVLELAEEDLALVSFLCPGKIEYGPRLRAVLDELERRSA